MFSRSKSSPQWFSNIFLIRFLIFLACFHAAAEERWWSEPVEGQLAKAGTNRNEIERALAEVPVPRREGMVFLVENMPDADLQSLSAAFLLENLNLAYDAWENAAWRTNVTKEMFFDEILPYACMDERREAWRAKLKQICEPLII